MMNKTIVVVHQYFSKISTHKHFYRRTFSHDCGHMNISYDEHFIMFLAKNIYQDHNSSIIGSSISDTPRFWRTEVCRRRPSSPPTWRGGWTPSAWTSTSSVSAGRTRIQCYPLVYDIIIENQIQFFFRKGWRKGKIGL